MKGIIEGSREVNIPLAHSQQEAAVPLTQKIVELERVKAALAKLEEIKRLENLEAKLAWELRDMKGVPSAQQMAAGEAGPAGSLHHRFMEQQMARKRERMIMQRAAIESLNTTEGEADAVNIPLARKIVELEQVKAAVVQLKQQQAGSDDVTLMTVAQPAAAVSGGAISGKITDAAGTGISGGYAVAYDASSNSWVAYGYADFDGSYTISGLPTGSYKVEFYPDGNYISEWYNDKSSFDTADAVSVTAPDTTANINAVLAEAGSISGKMTDAAGAGVTGYIEVYNASSGSWIAGHSTETDGSYTIGGLPAGSYKVEFSPSGNYLSEWYNDKSSIITAAAVSVTVLKTTANINAVLAEGGSISGKMTNAAGAGLAGYVVVYNASSGYYAGYSYTSDGSYTVVGLPTGSYKVEFRPSGSYVSEWYSDKSSFDTAATVSVTAPNTTANINAVLAEGGSISGKITDAAGAEVSGRVVVYDLDGGFVRDAYASVDGLRTGSYKIRFSDYAGRYASEWHNDKNSFAAADAVSVTAPNTTSNINAVLAQGGSISGKMTTPDGEGIYDGVVFAYPSDDKTMEAGYSWTNGEGGYVISGLKTGTYKVQFNPNSNSCSDGKPYVDEWYNNRGSFSSADRVQVTSPNTTSGVNAAVDTFKGGSVVPVIINMLLH